MIGWLAKTWGIEGGAIENETNNNESKVDTFNLVLGIAQADREVRNDTATEDRNIGFFDFLFVSPSNDSDRSENPRVTTSQSEVYRSYGIEVRDAGFLPGSQFRSRIDSALGLLERYAPEMLREIQQYTRYITDTNKRSSHAITHVGGTYINRSRYDDAIESLTGVLVHEGRHNKINSAENSASEERECMALQAECLKKLGGSWHEIRYLERQDGTHYLR